MLATPLSWLLYPSFINDGLAKYQTKKIEFIFNESLNTITINYHKDNSNIFYYSDPFAKPAHKAPYYKSQWGLLPNVEYERQSQINNSDDGVEYESKFCDGSIVINKGLIENFSLIELINEFMSCYENNNYLACYCLIREMILEIALLHKLSLADKNGEISFQTNINNICKHGYMTKNEKKFWLNLNKGAGDVVHYKKNNKKTIADKANQGIVYIFEHIQNIIYRR